MTGSTPTANESAYSPFAEHAARLGYTGDPTLEPSPFFTTMRGYLREQLQESTHA
jgi:hypothetical protein